MFKSWKLGRFAGIDVFLHPTFLLLLLFAEVRENLALTVGLFGCVLLHEFGHALMARRFGIGTADVTLYPIGGVARLTRMPRAPGVELLIALAGPAVNVAIALGLYLAFDALVAMGLGTFTVQLLAVNLILAAFNMIPAFPMDGGRVLRALLGGWLGRAKATVFAASVGRALALGFGVYSLLNGNLMQVALAAFIFLAAGAEEAGVLADERRRGTVPRDDLDWAAPPGHRWERTGRGVWRLAPIEADSHSHAASGSGGDPRWN